MPYGYGVDYRLTAPGMGLPECQRPGSPNITAFVSQFNTRFAVVSPINLTAKNEFTSGRHSNLGPGKPATRLHFFDLRA